MNAVTPDAVQDFLREYVAKYLCGQGREVPPELSDDCDLLLSGYVDSLGLLELMTAIQDHFGREIDFDELDAEQMTIVGPLKRFVAEKLAKA
jgi:acyl carrier protein